MEIFEKYDNLDSDYIPDNRPKCHCYKPIEIMTGETAVNTFEVPLSSTDLANYEVIYKLGIEPVLIQGKTELELVDDEEHGGCIITSKLDAEQTKLFAHTTLDSNVQLKFYLTNGSISYSRIYKIIITNSLDTCIMSDADNQY